VVVITNLMKLTYDACVCVCVCVCVMKQSFLGRVIIDLDTKAKVAITEQSFKLEETDKEWARDLLLITGSITVSIEEL
jgi:hypothetical protein